MAKKIKNPFIHSHDDDECDHHHHHEDVHLPVTDDLDPAQRSLADALRVSFLILQVIMVILLVLYLGSNIFNVSEQEVAVRLRLGKIVGQTAEQQIIQPGGPHFALPEPIEQVVRIPTATQRLDLPRAFWFETTAADAGRTEEELAASRQGPLNPERDGSLLTGDANIIHLRVTLNYKIVRPIDFIRHVAQPSRHAETVLARAEQLVIAAAEQGVIFAAAHQEADDIIKAGTISSDMAKARINGVLGAMNTGIEVDNVRVSQVAIPHSVRQAFQAVINAENEKAQLIDQAEQQRAEILGQAAGEAYEPLLKLITAYEEATTAGDSERLADLESRLDTVFRTLRIPLSPDEGGQGVEGDGQAAMMIGIGGQVARVINEANTFRAQLGPTVQAEAEVFASELEQFMRYPAVVLARKWFEVKQEVLSGDVETLYVPQGQTYLELNRDPDIQRQIEAERLRLEDEARRGGR